MSMYTQVDVEICDMEIAIEVLSEIFGPNLENHCDNPQALRGYRGDNRSALPTTNKNYAPKCHLIVRRQNLWTGANDFGVHQGADGKITLYVSQFDRGKGAFAGGKLTEMKHKIKRIYSEKLVMRKARMAGYRVRKKVSADGQIKLVLKRK